MNPVIYKLKEPIELDGEKIERLELQHPRGKHIKNIDTNNLTIGVIMVLAAKISGHRPKLFDEMIAADVMAIAGIVGDFLGDGQETGLS